MREFSCSSHLWPRNPRDHRFVDAKRTIIAVVAFCLGLATAATAFYTLRPSPRTVVDAIEVAPTRGDGESGPDRKSRPPKKRSGDDKPGRRGRQSGPSDDQRPNDQRPNDDGGAVPAVPPPPAPAGDDDDDAAEGSGDDDDGDGGEEDDDDGGDD
jgi:hypothetical protein